jgi:membrane protein implicated in regulation of membrane protease activity
VFLIVSIVLLLYLRRRMKQKQQQRLQHPGMSEMEGSSRGLKHFVGGRWRAEQDGTSQPVEAGSTSVKIIPGPPVELDSTPAERSR